jgi:hypothetical protein
MNVAGRVVPAPQPARLLRPEARHLPSWCRASSCLEPLAGLHDEVTAAHARPDQALRAQHRQRSLSGALRYPVLLREGLHGRDSPLQLPGLDLGAQDCRQL